jgi:hypothetical protein
MKITNTHFILGTILFVVIMISLTTSCCDFMPYSRPRGSLGMSVYEGMKEGATDEDDNETEGMKEGADEDDKETEGMKEGADEDETEGMKEGADEDEPEDKKKEETTKEGFGFTGRKGLSTLEGGDTNAFKRGWSDGNGSWGGWRGWKRGGEKDVGGAAVPGMSTTGVSTAQNSLLAIQRPRGVRTRPGNFETMTNNQTEPSPMSALAQSVFGSSVAWSK